MIKIKLFCAAGFSTSMLVEKMIEAAKLQNLEVDIQAHSHANLRDHINDTDVALLGPQVGYALAKAKEVCDPVGLPVEVIPMIDYGTMNGQKVLEFALNLHKNKG
ncbi:MULTISPECIES: PTS sugar transporter subunit IIB [Gilliamella]|uniref:PTS sugar transporter subunit IIB n=1 Tax=Gilliamella apis TaxID=1970738 RepID=A0A242NTU7_9GAMM|nr:MULTISPECIES: PTS sugar transporter subunit IIB [Gilliamella]MBI0104116.1 PTS sugar transporter subunit IIB [Gilliamella sp. W8145]MCT6866849.1 PTS sugar transporter subunit IIB [Gilliamella apicola]OCG09599.1 PTS sugar transporter subunit IIB [Gilliamella apis]OTQ48904.1 PTS sugar transporter subunit IIB [Gilliamella apis]